MVYLSTLANIKPIIEYCGGTEIGGGYVSSVVVLPNFPAAFNTPAVGLDFVLIENQDESDSLDVSVPAPVKNVPTEIGPAETTPAQDLRSRKLRLLKKTSQKKNLSHRTKEKSF